MSAIDHKATAVFRAIIRESIADGASESLELVQAGVNAARDVLGSIIPAGHVVVAWIDDSDEEDFADTRVVEVLPSARAARIGGIYAKPHA